jgi:hypothetical protein
VASHTNDFGSVGGREAALGSRPAAPKPRVGIRNSSSGPSKTLVEEHRGCAVSAPSARDVDRATAQAVLDDLTEAIKEVPFP